jgi:hypothetical protein
MFMMNISTTLWTEHERGGATVLHREDVRNTVCLVGAKPAPADEAGGVESLMRVDPVAC